MCESWHRDTTGAVGRFKKKKKKMTKTRFCRFPDLTLTGRSGTLWTKDHSRNTVSYLKGLRIQAFESLEAFKMYYAIGASVSYLHRESTDSLISFVVNITSIDAWTCMLLFT